MLAPVDGVLVLTPATPAPEAEVVLDVVDVPGVAVVVLLPGVLLVMLVVVLDDVVVDDDVVLLELVVVPGALQVNEALFVAVPANVPEVLDTCTRHEL